MKQANEQNLERCVLCEEMKSPFLFMNLLKGLFVLYINFTVLQQAVDFGGEHVSVVSGFSYFYRFGARGLLNLVKKSFHPSNWENLIQSKTTRYFSN